MSASGQYLPRHLTERGAALPHKAAALIVRCRGSYGPLATFCSAERQRTNQPSGEKATLNRLPTANIAKLRDLLALSDCAPTQTPRV